MQTYHSDHSSLQSDSFHKTKRITNTIRSPLSTDHRSKEPQPDTYEKDGRGYTHSEDNKSCDHYEGPHNNQNSPACHAEPSPCMIPPSELPSLMSSHASSPSSSSSALKPYDEPPCDLTDGTSALAMELSYSQKETKEEVSEETDLREGGPPCPIETSEWRSWNKVGIGDALKSPKIGHWQASENL